MNRLVNREALRIAFFGTPDFALPCLSTLLASEDFVVGAVITQPDAPAGRGKTLQASPIKKLALEHALPILQPERIRNNEEFFQTLDECGPFHFLVVVAFGQILPQRLLDMPSIAPINVHASLLPRWRGAAPIQRAILAGDRETGVCIMHMQAGLDTGPVYARKGITIAETMTGGELHDALSLLGAKLLMASLPGIASQALEARAQSSQDVSYADKIEKSELCISWEKNSRDVLNHIRAFAPSPGAFTCYAGKRLKIFQAQASSLPLPIGEAGSCHVDPQGGSLHITCRDAWIEVREVQPEARVRMSARDFLLGLGKAYPKQCEMNI